VKNITNLPEQQQIEWAKKESLKFTGNYSYRNEDDNERNERNEPYGNEERESVERKDKYLCDSSGSTASKQSKSGRVDVDTGDMDVDMDFTDEELLSVVEDTCGQDKEENDQVVFGLKGGARGGDTKVRAPIPHVTFVSDDSDQSGLDDKKGLSKNNNDSSDTSLDEEGGTRKRFKDNSLCSLIDQRPVLSKFSGDLLIESDSNETSSKTDSKKSFSERNFFKSVASPFNAKFKPSIKEGMVRSASKYPIRTSPSRVNRLSQTTHKPSKKNDNAFGQDVLQSDFDDKEVAEAIQKSLEDQVCICFACYDTRFCSKSLATLKGLLLVQTSLNP
jgi:hypothetical protein